MKPRNIVIMRHAESLEDVDKDAYAFTPDQDMPLTSNGKDQAVALTRELNRIWSNKRSSVRFYLSPIKRVRETAAIICSNISPEISHSVTSELLMAKQDWGNVTVDNKSQIDRARYEAGVLKYQFPGGESGPQLLERFERFIQKLWTDFEKPSFSDDVVLITHGFEMRVLLKIIFGWSEEYFETLAHPKHCEFRVLTLQSDGSYALDREMRIVNSQSNPNFIRKKH